MEEFETLPISEDHLVAVLPKSHPLAKEKTLVFSQLENESLLLISRNSFMYKLCTDLCREAGFQPRITTTIFMAWLKNRKFNPACRRFLEIAGAGVPAGIN